MPSCTKRREILACRPSGYQLCLQVLRLSRCTLGPAAAAPIVALLRGPAAARLQELDLGGNPLGDAAAESIARAAAAARALAVLRLPETGCGPQAAARLAALLRGSAGLRELDVGWNVLGGGEAAAALCRAAGEAPSLRVLGLQWVGLGGGSGGESRGSASSSTAASLIAGHGGDRPEAEVATVPPACVALAAAVRDSGTLEKVDCCGNRLGPAAAALLSAAAVDAAARAPPCSLLLDPPPPTTSRPLVLPSSLQPGGPGPPDPETAAADS